MCRESFDLQLFPENLEFGFEENEDWFKGHEQGFQCLAHTQSMKAPVKLVTCGRRGLEILEILALLVMGSNFAGGWACYVRWGCFLQSTVKISNPFCYSWTCWFPSLDKTKSLLCFWLLNQISCSTSHFSSTAFFPGTRTTVWGAGGEGNLRTEANCRASRGEWRRRHNGKGNIWDTSTAHKTPTSSPWNFFKGPLSPPPLPALLGPH